ncbi:TonB-dependent receptor [Xanthobacter sp. V13C-7B]|uniref:TonB-dependent receptor plug domain-containing protein n=2 Tax=Xanthobacter variabilis TaxID=3119932 RepID=UPI0037289434
MPAVRCLAPTPTPALAAPLASRARQRRAARLSFSVSLLAVMAATPALAQSAATASDGSGTQITSAQTTDGTQYELPDVVVSATTIATPAREVASSVTVITGQQLEETQRRDVPDALQSVPGLNVVQTGGPGGGTSVFMRGTNSNQTKILLDGIDLGDPSSGNGAFDLGTLYTNDFARMEVLRGPQSGLYGSDAIGGVISMTTERGSGPAKANGYLEAGSLGTFNQAAALSGGYNNIGYAFNVGHFASTSIPVTPSDILLPGEQANDNASDNWTYSGRIDADVSDAFSVNVMARYIQTRLAYTSDLYNYSTGTGYPAPLQDIGYGSFFIGKAEGQWKALDDKLVSTFGIAATDYARDNSSPYPNNFSDYTGDRQTYYWRSNYTFLPGQSLLFGVERYNESMTSESAWSSMDASTGDTAGYLQLQSSFFERLFLAANVRYDSNDDFGDHTTWRLAPALLFPETGTKLKVTYGTGFKAPTLYQLYSTSGGNPNLEPEESTGWDAGFEQALWADRVSFGATYFENDITNLINSVQVSPYVWTNANIASVTSDGWETFVAVKVTDNFSVRADYTYTNTVGHPEDGVSPGSCAPTGLDTCAPLRRPKDKVSVAVNWQPVDPLTLTATLIYLSDWWDIDRTTFAYVKQPGYTIFNVAANYTVNENVKVFGRIDNLFDETYENPNGWLAPGMAAYAGLKLTY